MRSSFSPQSPWLNRVLSGALTKPGSDDVVVVHHITETRSGIQIEVERRRVDGGIEFSRVRLAGEAVDQYPVPGRYRGLTWSDTEAHLAMAKAAFEPFHELRAKKVKLTKAQEAEYSAIRRWCVELGAIRFEMVRRRDVKKVSQ
jgi:hypothetical protein